MFWRIVAIVAFAVLGMVSAQDGATTPSVCSTGCVNGVIVNAANIGCPNGDTVCVCGKTESFHDGIRDCITAACAPDGPDVQIPLAIAYGEQICAAANTPAPAPSSSTAAPPPEPTSTDDLPASSSTPAPSVDSPSQTTAIETTTSSADTSGETIASATGNDQTAPAASPSPTSGPSSESSASLSPTASASTAASSSPTKSGASQPASTSDTSDTSSTSPGLSTAAKAGIGAGIGAAALAAIIIALCSYLQRRQRNKSANRVRNYKISEPMSSTDHQFANDIGRAETTLPTPIITTRLAPKDSAAQPISPTSVYSNASDLENHARRYEDMLPRTQPRTMI